MFILYSFGEVFLLISQEDWAAFDDNGEPEKTKGQENHSAYPAPQELPPVGFRFLTHKYMYSWLNKRLPDFDGKKTRVFHSLTFIYSELKVKSREGIAFCNSIFSRSNKEKFLRKLRVQVTYHRT